MSRTGVVVLSHGTPATRDELAPFYTRIRHGSPPTQALLDELASRYDAIGGLSPLTARTRAQVDGLGAILEQRAPGRFAVEAGTKYASPTIEEAVDRLVLDDVAGVVGLILSPLNAPVSTDDYHRRAEAALGGRAGYRAIWSWWDAAGLHELLATRVRDALGEGRDDALVLFTAHSVPAKLPGAADYAAQLQALADGVAGHAKLERYRACWQSAGRTSDEWLGPGLLEVLASLDAREVREVVVCPVGFVADHLEVLYDVDREAHAAAAARGVALRRTRSLNDDAAFLSILADVVEAVAAPA